MSGTASPARGPKEPDAEDEGPWIIEPYEVHPAWVFFGVFSLLLGVGIVVVNSMMLEAQRPLECSALPVIGGVLIPIGVILCVLGVLALKFRIIQRPAEISTAGYVCRVVGGVCVSLVYIVLLLVCVVSAAVYVMSRNTPRITLSYGGVPGISADVAIVRDEWGVPHIDAATVDDATFAQGFVTAQDRLAQLEIIRLAAYGRLSKYVGDAALDVDKAVRGTGFAHAGVASCALMNATAAHRFQRYVDGINHYLDVDYARPPEFMFLGTLLVFHEPEPFTRNDVCVMAKLIQWQITRSIAHESRRWELFSQLGMTREEVLALDPVIDTPEDAIFNNSFYGYDAADTARRNAAEARDDAIERELYATVMGRFRESQPATNGASTSRRQSDDSTSAAQDSTAKKKTKKEPSGLEKLASIIHIGEDFPGYADGSNAWAMRSASGTVVVASDPHLATQLPAFWFPFYVTIRGTSFGYGGTSVPGIPGVMIGRNSDVAWGITISYTDLGDLYVMEPDPARPATHYLHNGAPRAYTFRREVIEVSGADDVVLTIKHSHYGPDIASAWELSDRHTICASARVLDVEASTYHAFANIVEPGLVTSVAALRENVFRLVQSPGLSIAIGDRHGGVGYAVTGQHKQRALGHTGRMPTYGNGSFDYVADIPWSSVPGFANTDTANPYAISAANQRISAPGDPVILTRDFLTAFRGNAIKEVINAAPPGQWSSVALSLGIQTNETSGAWRYKLRDVLDSTSNTFGATFNANLNAAGQAMLARIRAWDQVSRRGSHEATMLWMFLAELTTVAPRVLARLERTMIGTDSFAVSIITTPSAETDALCSAATAGSGFGGRTCAHWAAKVWNDVAARNTKAWGTEASRQELRHLLLHESVVECMFSRAVDRGGDPTAIAAKFFANDGDRSELVANGGPSMRFVMDWATPDFYRFALPGGASGNPFSEYYTNLASAWADGDYRVVRVTGYSDKKRQYLKP